MKTLKLLIPFLLLGAIAKAQLPSTELYEHFILTINADKAPAGYGLSADKPITVGAYEDLTSETKQNQLFMRFYNSYQWPDGSMVKYIDRKTKMVNNANVELFRTVKPGTQDTITLYVDLYKSGPVYVPEGFKAFTKELLAEQFAPTLQQIKTYDATADKFGDATAKLTSIQLLAYLQTNVGLDYLMDKDQIGNLMENYGMDTDLKAYLMRSYIFHKFEFEVTGQDNAKVKAFNAMVDDYLDATKKHADLITGDMSAIMVKKS